MKRKVIMRRRSISTDSLLARSNYHTLAQALMTLLLISIGIVALSACSAGPQLFTQSVALAHPADQIQNQATAAVQQFHKEAMDWGKAHQFKDSFDGKSYELDPGYLAKGIGEDLDRELNAGNYQKALSDAQDELFNLHMMEKDSNDKTPFSKVHQTDLQLLDHYQLKQAKVIVISTYEQAVRLYDNGKLVHSTLATLGSPDLPVVPGLWSSMWRQTNTTFHSPYPKGSPNYYTPTKINYGIMYHEGGYYVHDAWWRNDFGPGTQFPHPDSSGNKSATVGTHGCINVPKDQMAWIYNNTDYSTMILIY